MSEKTRPEDYYDEATAPDFYETEDEAWKALGDMKTADTYNPKYAGRLFNMQYTVATVCDGYHVLRRSFID